MLWVSPVVEDFENISLHKNANTCTLQANQSPGKGKHVDFLDFCGECLMFNSFKHLIVVINLCFSFSEGILGLVMVFVVPSFLSSQTPAGQGGWPPLLSTYFSSFTYEDISMLMLAHFKAVPLCSLTFLLSQTPLSDNHQHLSVLHHHFRGSYVTVGLENISSLSDLLTFRDNRVCKTVGVFGQLKILLLGLKEMSVCCSTQEGAAEEMLFIYLAIKDRSINICVCE